MTLNHEQFKKWPATTTIKEVQTKIEMTIGCTSAQQKLFLELSNGSDMLLDTKDPSKSLRDLNLPAVCNVNLFVSSGLMNGGAWGDGLDDSGFDGTGMGSGWASSGKAPKGIGYDQGHSSKPSLDVETMTSIQRGLNMRIAHVLTAITSCIIATSSASPAAADDCKDEVTAHTSKMDCRELATSVDRANLTAFLLQTLQNDAILEIEKHVALYRAVFGLIDAMARQPLLSNLLQQTVTGRTKSVCQQLTWFRSQLEDVRGPAARRTDTAISSEGLGVTVTVVHSNPNAVQPLLLEVQSDEHLWQMRKRISDEFQTSLDRVQLAFKNKPVPVQWNGKKVSQLSFLKSADSVVTASVIPSPPRSTLLNSNYTRLLPEAQHAFATIFDQYATTRQIPANDRSSEGHHHGRIGAASNLYISRVDGQPTIWSTSVSEGHGYTYENFSLGWPDSLSLGQIFQAREGGTYTPRPLFVVLCVRD
jgi:hypothetical protein